MGLILFSAAKRRDVSLDVSSAKASWHSSCTHLQILHKMQGGYRGPQREIAPQACERFEAAAASDEDTVAPCWMRAKTNFSRSEAVMSERVRKEALLIVPPSIAQMFGLEGIGKIIIFVFGVIFRILRVIYNN